MKDQSELKTERFQMVIEKSALEALDDWCFSNRVRSRAEAIRQFIHNGITSSENGTNNEKASARS